MNIKEGPASMPSQPLEQTEREEILVQILPLFRVIAPEMNIGLEAVGNLVLSYEGETGRRAEDRESIDVLAGKSDDERKAMITRMVSRLRRSYDVNRPL